MVLIPWQCYRSLTTFAEQMNQLFDRFFQEESGCAGGLVPSYPETTMKELRDRFLVTVKVTGFAREELRVTVEKNHLMIVGERKASRAFPAGTTTAVAFRRTLRFSHELKAEDIVARYENEKLMILIPKERGDQPRTITIS